MTDILRLLQQDARYTPDQIATMLDRPLEEVEKEIEQLEKDKVILGYRAVVNPEKLKQRRESVSAVIEVKVSPERGVGFDAIAERLYRFPEVQSLYLMSGGYDFLVVIEGESLQAIAIFVMEKLSTLDHVNSTATRFLLKRYKENGVILNGEDAPPRLAVTP